MSIFITEFLIRNAPFCKISVHLKQKTITISGIDVDYTDPNKLKITLPEQIEFTDKGYKDLMIECILIELKNALWFKEMVRNFHEKIWDEKF